MCYINCIYESLNPVTGICTCHKGKNPCPETFEDTELVMCPYCDIESPMEDDETVCPECGATILR